MSASRKNYEQAITVTFEGQRGANLTTSAILIRDVAHLKPNRMELLGSKDDDLLAMGFMSDALVNWSFFENELWPAGSARLSSIRRGRGYFVSTGFTQGFNISPDSIQKFGDFIITEDLSEVVGLDLTSHGSSQFLFIQRPPRWYVGKRSLSLNFSLQQFGDWFSIPRTPYRFRLVDEGILHDEPRECSEVQFVRVPGVEIAKKIKSNFDESIIQEVSDIWESMSIVIMFYYRMHITMLEKTDRYAGKLCESFYPQPVKPRRPVTAEDHPIFSGKAEMFFAQGAATLFKLRDQQSRFYASVYGYIESFTASSVEGQLTSCFEAIERLVTAHEMSRGLTRELMQKSIWLEKSKPLYDKCNEIDVDDDTRSALKASIKSPPVLNIEQRVRRMAEYFSSKMTEAEMALLANFGLSVTMRNKIVHGKIPDDHSGLIPTFGAHGSLRR